MLFIQFFKLLRMNSFLFEHLAHHFVLLVNNFWEPLGLFQSELLIIRFTDELLSEIFLFLFDDLNFLFDLCQNRVTVFVCLSLSKILNFLLNFSKQICRLPFTEKIRSRYLLQQTLKVLFVICNIIFCHSVFHLEFNFQINDFQFFCK